jgi:hypothetical protein
MAHLKPIYLFGMADYGPVAHHIKTYDDLVRHTTPIKSAVSDDDMKRFVHFYRTKYLVRIDDGQALEAAIATRLME